jgi:hypothetical protein
MRVMPLRIGSRDLCRRWSRAERPAAAHAEHREDACHIYSSFDLKLFGFPLIALRSLLWLLG